MRFPLKPEMETKMNYSPQKKNETSIYNMTEPKKKKVEMHLIICQKFKRQTANVFLTPN